MEKYIKVGNVYKLERKSAQPVDDIKAHKEYRKSKVMKEHLEAILKVVDLSIKGLSHFEVYEPVHRILVTLRNERPLLDSNLQKHVKIVKAKGKLEQ